MHRVTSPGTSDDAIEQISRAKNLTAPRVSIEDVKAAIRSHEFIKYKSPSGQILRWAVITLDNGYAVTGRPSAAVDPANDLQEIGERVAYDNAVHELWQLLGFRLRDKMARASRVDEDRSFSWALIALKMGERLRRTGWNGKNMWIKLQTPTEKSMMSLPYLYMCTADGQLVPWLASQTDLLAADWEVVE